MNAQIVSIDPRIDRDIRESASALISQHGDHALAYAVERAREIRARGRRRVSAEWEAVAQAIHHMTGRA